MSRIFKAKIRASHAVCAAVFAFFAFLQAARAAETNVFLGAARNVTGSCHELTVGGSKILLDCGQIQGSRLDEQLNRVPLPVGRVDAVVLSHAHIDHSGRLPLLHAQRVVQPRHLAGEVLAGREAVTRALLQQ